MTEEEIVKNVMLKNQITGEFVTLNEVSGFFSSLRLDLDKELETEIKQKHKLVKVKLPPKFLDMLWNQLHILPIERFIGTQDIFISSDWTQPPSSAKKVTIVHDLVYLRYPETVHKKILDVQKRRLNLVKKEVDIILADSQATKDDLIELLTIPKEKIHVLYPAVDIKKSSLPLTTNYQLPTTKYILSVGKLEPRKNIGRLIEAFKLVNLPDTELLIIGPKGWGEEGRRSMGDRGGRGGEDGNIRFLGFVPDDKLYKLYSNAEFFVYPSLYEGFGYPVIEAMAMGCPVATSNTSSLKEIGKDSVLLFDPKNVESIKDALVTMASNSKIREKYKEKGLSESKMYTSGVYIKNLLHILFTYPS